MAHDFKTRITSRIRAVESMAALTNALQALSARAKQTVMRQPNAVADLHKSVRDAVAHDEASLLTQPGPQIDALLDAMAAVDAAALNIDGVQRPGACTYLGIVENDEYAIAAFVLAPHATDQVAAAVTVTTASTGVVPRPVVPEAFEDPAVVTAATLARDARERYEALGVEF